MRALPSIVLSMTLAVLLAGFFGVASAADDPSHTRRLFLGGPSLYEQEESDAAKSMARRHLREAVVEALPDLLPHLLPGVDLDISVGPDGRAFTPHDLYSGPLGAGDVRVRSLFGGSLSGDDAEIRAGGEVRYLFGGKDGGMGLSLGLSVTGEAGLDRSAVTGAPRLGVDAAWRYGDWSLGIRHRDGGRVGAERGTEALFGYGLQF